jgi:hypothetical protein
VKQEATPEELRGFLMDAHNIAHVAPAWGRA